MRVGEHLNGVSALIKGGAAVIALLPGVATLVGLVDIPPSIGTLVSFISVFVGLACLIGVGLTSDRIARLSGTKALILIAALALSGSASATGYYLFARAHILSIDDAGHMKTVVIPLRPSPDVRAIVGLYEGDYVEALETSVMKVRLLNLLDRECGTTIVLLVILLVAAQSASISAVVLGAWKLTSEPQRSAAISPASSERVRETELGAGSRD
jgi:hypothetical protein